MGALFQRLSNTNFAHTPSTSKSDLVDLSAYQYTIQEQLEMEDKFSSIVIESLRGMYFGYKEGIPSLVSEASLDFSINLSKWLDEWVKSIADFEKKSIKRLTDKHKELATKANKFGNTPVAEIVEVFDYKDFNVYNQIDPFYFNELISKIISGIHDIETATKGNVATSIAKALNDISNPDLLNTLRGKIIKTGPIEESKYKDTLTSLYIGPKTRFDLNTATMYSMTIEINKMGDLFKSLTKDFNTIKSLSKKSIEFLNKNVSFNKTQLEKVEKNDDFTSYDSEVLHMQLRGKKLYLAKAVTAIKNLIRAYQICMAVKLDAINKMLATYDKYYTKAYGGAK